MADTRITDMPLATVLNDADVAPIVQGGVNKRTDLALLTAFVLATVSGGGGKGNFFFGSNKPSGLVTGKLAGYWTCPFAGTISAWNLTVDVGTITVRIWKKATGTTHPIVTDLITTGIALTTGTHIHSTTLTSFTTTAVAIGDIFAAEVSAVGGSVTDFGGSIEITKS